MPAGWEGAGFRFASSLSQRTLNTGGATPAVEGDACVQRGVVESAYRGRGAGPDLSLADLRSLALSPGPAPPRPAPRHQDGGAGEEQGRRPAEPAGSAALRANGNHLAR